MESLRAVRDGLLGTTEVDDDCDCKLHFEGDRLHVDASACSGDGRLAKHEACRASVVRCLTERDADAVHVEQAGLELVYDGVACALLVAAGRFRQAVEFRDERLADRAASDPLGACHEAVGRADAVADVAAESGLAELVDGVAATRRHSLRWRA